MNYRTIYTDNKVIATTIDNTNTITSSNGKFIIDTIENTISILSARGIDISFFWKNGYIDRLTPGGNIKEIDISDHPNFPLIKRKVFIYIFLIDQVNLNFSIGIVIRHFDSFGNHVYETHDDEFYVSIGTNDRILFYNGDINSSLLAIKEVKEYDYYLNQLDSEKNFLDVQKNGILLLDYKERFNNIYE